MFYARLDKIDKYQHRWPDEYIEKYDALFFKIWLDRQDVSVIVGFTKRKAFRKNRNRVVIFVKGIPEVEFCGVDDYKNRGQLIAVLKKPKTEKMYSTTEFPTSEYSEFQIVRHKDFIKAGYNRLAILVRTDDIHSMIKHALIRVKLEDRI